MKLQGKLVNMTITEEKTLSFKVRINETTDNSQLLSDIKELKEGKPRKYTLANQEAPGAGIYFTGQIKSMNIVKGLAIVLHTQAIPVLVVKAMDLIGLPASIQFLTDHEQELIDLVNAAARKEGISHEEIVYRLTTFAIDGRTIEGKKSIFEISEKQQKVVLSKLHKILSEKP